MTIRLYIMAALVAMIVSSAALAKPEDKSNKPEKNDKPGMSEHKDSPPGKKLSSGGHDHDGKIGLHLSIPSADQLIIREFLRTSYGSSCPPGLAKKQNGCLPPGIAKKYAVGHVLTPGLGISLPHALLTRLHPIPGHHYVMVDKDVLLIAEASKLVIDAVTLLSAVD